MLVALLAAVTLVGLLAVLYLWVLPRTNATAVPITTLEQPGTATSSPKSAHPLAKHLEVTGVRITEAASGRAKIQFVIVNHSGADLPEMEIAVSIRSADRDFFDFSVKAPSIGPYESKEMSTTVKTALRPYEMPDWQLIRPRFEINSEP